MAASKLPRELFPKASHIQLPDRSGRLCYATYGPSTGFPILFLHGYPGSRLEPMVISHLAWRHNVFVVAPDRPGFGRSSRQLGRRIGDYPKDLNQLTRHLKLQRYAVLGGSGGGPYAVACAHRSLGLPRAELGAVGVLAGAPPWEAGVRDVSLDRRVVAWMSKTMPSVLRVGADGLVLLARWVLSTAYVKNKIELWLESEARKSGEMKSQLAGKQQPIDLQAASSYTPEQQREMLVEGIMEGFAQGSDAAVEEARLLTEPWGFRFEDVTHNRLFIWHGAKDTNAPISMIRWMVERLPHARFEEFADDSHYTIGGKFGQFVDQLVHAAKSGEEMSSSSDAGVGKEKVEMPVDG